MSVANRQFIVELQYHFLSTKMTAENNDSHSVFVKRKWWKVKYPETFFVLNTITPSTVWQFTTIKITRIYCILYLSNTIFLYFICSAFLSFSQKLHLHKNLKIKLVCNEVTIWMILITSIVVKRDWSVFLYALFIRAAQQVVWCDLTA